MNSPVINLGTAGLVLDLRLYFQAGAEGVPELQATGDAAVVEIGSDGDYYLTGLADPGAGYIGSAVVIDPVDPASALYTYSYNGVSGLVPGAGTLPISIARLQAYLGVTGDETYLTQVELAAVADIERLTGWYLGTSKPITDVLDVPVTVLRLVRAAGQAERFQKVQISQPAALSALTISERSDMMGDWEEVDKLDAYGAPVFEVDGRTLYRRIGAWPEGERVVKVEYPFGYAVDTLPARFESVLLDLVAERYRGLQARSLGAIASASVQGNSVTFRSDTSGRGMSDGLWKRIASLRWED